MIPVNEPLLEESDSDRVLEALRTGWISSAGPFLEEFEHRWAALCGRSHGVAVANGTVALELAVNAAGILPGTEIIMPSFTIVSCVLAALYNQCTPVFVDSDPDTWCMDVGAIEERITERTAAIMPVHIYGHPVEMGPLLELAAAHGLIVIEDAAEAHGAKYRYDRDGSAEWKTCGSMGSVSTFSFYANKLVTTGEGGMLVMDSPELAERAKSLRNLAFAPARRFQHEERGYNFRLTNLQAALGLGQLDRFETIVEKKRHIAHRYIELLGPAEGLQLPTEKPWARSVYWMFGIVLEDEVPMNAAVLADRLRLEGIETRPFFLGMHEQPFLSREGIVSDPSEYPVTHRLSRRGLYLPSGLALHDEQIDQVAEHVLGALADA